MVIITYIMVIFISFGFKIDRKRIGKRDWEELEITLEHKLLKILIS